MNESFNQILCKTYYFKFENQKFSWTNNSMNRHRSVY